MRISLVRQGHPLRSTTEAFIADVYRDAYCAEVKSFAPTLVAMLDGLEVRCAAGLRFADDGFFSQCYVDEPIQRLLPSSCRDDENASRIFEVASLCSRSPADAPRFLKHIVAFGESAGFEWAVFTATERLRRLLTRLGLPMTLLALADASRVERPETWGSYYHSRPAVLAVNRDLLAAANRRAAGEARVA